MESIAKYTTMFIPRPKIHAPQFSDVIRRPLFLGILNIMSPIILILLFWKSSFDNLVLIARLFNRRSIACDATYFDEQILSQIWSGEIGVLYKVICY